MTGRWRVRAALVLAAASGVGALLLASSPPTFPSWIAHLAALELSVLIAAAAALALLLTTGLSVPGAAIARLAAVPALVVGLIPALVVVPLYREHRAPFSMRAYLPGPRTEPPSRRDVILDPARPDLAADIDLPPGPGPIPSSSSSTAAPGGAATRARCGTSRGHWPAPAMSWSTCGTASLPRTGSRPPSPM